MAGRQPSSPRTELASERTDYAVDRTVLAGERTYAAWVRTGLASLVAGLAILRFMNEVMSDWGLRLVALALMVNGLVCFVIAIWRCREMRRHLPDPGIARLGTTALLGTTGLLIAAALITLVSVVGEWV